jgi:hypothetical protein
MTYAGGQTGLRGFGQCYLSSLRARQSQQQVIVCMPALYAKRHAEGAYTLAEAHAPLVIKPGTGRALR